MLSRKDIRPEQIQMLLERGFLPISIDYRLCPEVTLFQGPMIDVADALAWIRTVLPGLKLARPDIRVDRDRVVSVGWSTGGTLAMSLAWNTLPRGIAPPNAILAFYCPSDYEDEFWTKPNIPAGSQTLDKSSPLVDLDDATWAGVYDHPIKAYNVPSSTNAVGGWMATTDARSRLVLYMNHRGRTLQTLLRGLDKEKKQKSGKELEASLPSPTEIRAVSPLAQVRGGAYRTPTFVVHPRQDDLIPWQQAQRTVDALKARDVPAKLRLMEKVPHLFDVHRNWQRNGDADRAVREGYDFLARWVGLG